MTNHRTAVRLIALSSLIIVFASTVADAMGSTKQAELKNDRYRVRLVDDTSVEVTEKPTPVFGICPSQSHSV